MSGHSKWANIKHKKDAADKKKGKVFSKLAKEIMVSVKQGGKDPDANPKLRLALSSARSVNMPRENIERAIKKGAGELGSVTYEEITYEGYGPGGIAIIVDCLTDNRNRIIGEVRLVFDRNGGNMGATGSVTWMFQRKARFVVSGENADESKLMDIVLDAGAEDIEAEDGLAEIWGPPEQFAEIAKALENAKVDTSESGLVRKPENLVGVNDLHVAQQAMRLIDRLEELDDVQNVYTNMDVASEVLDQIAASEG